MRASGCLILLLATLILLVLWFARAAGVEIAAIIEGVL